MPEPDLFSIKAKEVIDALTVTTTQRTVTDYWIVIGDKKFDAEDIYETLNETCDWSSDSYITDRTMVEQLKSIGVLVHGGSGRWAMTPEKGPNYEYFMTRLRTQLKRHKSDKV